MLPTRCNPNRFRACIEIGVTVAKIRRGEIIDKLCGKCLAQKTQRIDFETSAVVRYYQL